MRNSLYIILILLCFEGAHSIGRIGNNTLIDPTEGFTAMVPPQFPNVDCTDATGPNCQSADRSMLLVSNETTDVESSEAQRGFGAPSQISAPVSMNLQPFALAFPSLATSTSDQMLAYLQTTDQFTMTALANQACGSFWIGENDFGFIGVARWGTSQGLVVTAQKTESNIGHDGILALFASLKITKCSQ